MYPARGDQSALDRLVAPVLAKALREAGVLRQRQYALERRSRVRTEDLDSRFPGELQLELAWEAIGE